MDAFFLVAITGRLVFFGVS
jgi:hypothetical protein